MTKDWLSRVIVSHSQFDDKAIFCFGPGPTIVLVTQVTPPRNATVPGRLLVLAIHKAIGVNQQGKTPFAVDNGNRH